ncbi:MAG: hypothetical protein U1D41_02510 [Nitrosomonas sp.]|nr:hypothetical protein [Nitrosomonas sp.]MDZ4105030.1 hypothetical protein [Nitrosomonas sp.]
MAKKPHSEILKKMDCLSGVLLRIVLVCAAAATVVALHSGW